MMIEHQGVRRPPPDGSLDGVDSRDRPSLGDRTPRSSDGQTNLSVRWQPISTLECHRILQKEKLTKKLAFLLKGIFPQETRFHIFEAGLVLLGQSNTHLKLVTKVNFSPI